MPAVNTPEPAPLRETLDRVDPDLYYFTMGLAPDEPAPDWRGPPFMADDGPDFLRGAMAATREQWSLTDRDLALAVVGDYAWWVGGPAVACYVLARRVPDVAPENLTFRHAETGRISEVALLSGRFAALPTDPAADPAVTTLDDEAALLGWLRGRLVAGLEPLVELVRANVRASRRLMWTRATDLLAQSMLTVARAAPDSGRYADDAAALVSHPGSLLAGKTGFFNVQDNGREHSFMVRGVCCNGFRLPGHGYCDSCPALSEQERQRRALESLAGRGQ